MMLVVADLTFLAWIIWPHALPAGIVSLVSLNHSLAKFLLLALIHTLYKGSGAFIA